MCVGHYPINNKLSQNGSKGKILPIKHTYIHNMHTYIRIIRKKKIYNAISRKRNSISLC